MVQTAQARALLALVGLVLIALAVAFRVLLFADTLTRLPVLIGLVHPLLFGIVLLAYVYRYLDHPDASTLFTTATIGAFGLAGIFALTGATIVWGQWTQGVALVDPDLIVIETGLGGGLIGLLVGHLYGRVLVQRRQLKAREQRLQVLTRVLRHNLRNRLNVALGHIETAADDAPESISDHLSGAETALDSLITTADLARDAQRTLTSSTPRERDLVGLVEQAVTRAREEYPDEDIGASTSGGDIPVTALDGTRDVIRELVRNACEHGDGPIEISVYPTDGAGIVEITDHGSGIADEELAVIEAGEETPLSHGSGLGLWIAHWIVRGSDGELRFETGGGTTVKMALPKAEGTLDRGDPRPGSA